MHRIQGRTYLGQPGEVVTVNTSVAGGGQAGVTVAGQPLAGGQFRLPNATGSVLRMQIALAGPKGASCAVTIAIVDGGQDTDFLLCTTFNPAPVNFYDFSVAAAAAVASLAAAKGVPVAAKAGTASAMGFGSLAAKPQTTKRPRKSVSKPRAAKATRRGK